jgi:hypothetical protein
MEETGLAVGIEDISQAYSKRLTDSLLHVVSRARVQNSDVSVNLSWEHSSYEWLPLAVFITMSLPDGVDDYHLTVLEYLKSDGVANY